MKRLGIVSLILSFVFLWIAAFMVAAQDNEDQYEYIGSRDCRDCHRDVYRAHALTAHALTFVELEEDMPEEENPVVADFSSNTEFGLDDVVYTLGVGRHVQAYVTETDDGYMVLPEMWNVESESWQSLDLASSWPNEAFAFGPNCAGCHTQDLDMDDYTWDEEGVMCESCHGPGLVHVEAADDAGGSVDEEEMALILGAINISVDGQVCGQCHSQGLATDGIHPYATDYYPGMSLDESFALAEGDDTYWPSGHARLPFMQYNEWISTGHPNSLESAQGSDHFKAECLSCHSATQHEIDLLFANEDIDPETIDPLAVLENSPFGVTCVSCHSPHRQVEEGEPTFAASLRNEADALCVSCHQDNDVTGVLHFPTRQVFEGVTLIEQVEGVPSSHYTAEDGPTCTTCHMPVVDTYFGERHSHTFQIVSPDPEAGENALPDSCSSCHEEGPAALAQFMVDLQDSTRSRVEAARAAVSDDTPDWVMTALTAVENEGSYGLHNYTYTDNLLDAVELQLNLLEGASS